MTLGSLFDGSGGFPLAGLAHGVTPVWASEIEPFPIRVTTKRIPEMKHYGDASKMHGDKIEPVDIITFGSPCQDMSLAGRRAGLNGSRSNLFYEAVRIIKEMRESTNGKYPKYAVWENVPGAFSSNKGEDFRCVLEAVIGIAEPNAQVPMPEKARWPYADLYMGDGWSVAYRTLDAQYWGVPQRRRRIYLVADFAGGSAGEILFEREGLSGYSAQSRRSGKGTPRSLESGLGNASDICLNDQGGQQMDLSYGISGTLRASMNGYAPIVLENHAQDGRVKIAEGNVTPTLSSHMGTGGNNVPLLLKIRSGCEGGGKGPLIQENKSATLSCNNDQTLFEPCGWDGGQVSPTLTKRNAGGNQRMPGKDNFTCVLQAFGIGSRHSKGMLSDNPKAGYYRATSARTLDANGGNPCANQGGIAVVSPHYQVRKLTPTECARLQGFPDWWCADLSAEDPTADELSFWREVFDTWTSLTGKKRKTDKQIVKWLKSPHSDSAEYKMWGNGVALPCVEFVLGGIARELKGENVK